MAEHVVHGGVTTQSVRAGGDEELWVDYAVADGEGLLLQQGDTAERKQELPDLSTVHCKTCIKWWSIVNLKA